MNNVVIEYSPTEMEMIQEFISENIGTSEGMVYHEIKSEYVHTDVDLCYDSNNKLCVDFKRDVYVCTLGRLRELLEELDEKGEEISYEINW